MSLSELTDRLKNQLAASRHPKELAVDVMFALQSHFGYFSDEALEIAAGLFDMSTVEIEELATFYTFIYRRPVGKYVIHVCDSVICWSEGKDELVQHLCQRLNICLGQTTPDGLFTILPVCCIGYCDRAPAVLINRRAYGPLTPEFLDTLIEEFRQKGGQRDPK
ncbi:MAG: NADH-quinone oxidoreductase subunit NuoE [Desulfobacteraceae bacterium]|jgi:NADH-quinone oxidoreductase subunit E